MSEWTPGRDYRRTSAYGGGERRMDEPRSFAREGDMPERGWSREPSSGYRFGRRDDRRFHNRDEESRVPRDETDRLIASDKVEGTRVYGRNGERLGTIENFMVDKRSGRVEYAVLSFGGALGMGDRHYPIPWHMLTYDEELGGYEVDMTERDLERAPSHRAGSSPSYDRGYGADIHGYYGW